MKEKFKKSSDCGSRKSSIPDETRNGSAPNPVVGCDDHSNGFDDRKNGFGHDAGDLEKLQNGSSQDPKDGATTRPESNGAVESEKVDRDKLKVGNKDQSKSGCIVS